MMLNLKSFVVTCSKYEIVTGPCIDGFQMHARIWDPGPNFSQLFSLSLNDEFPIHLLRIINLAFSYHSNCVEAETLLPFLHQWAAKEEREGKHSCFDTAARSAEIRSADGGERLCTSRRTRKEGLVQGGMPN